MREILKHGSVRGSNQQHPRNTHPKAQKQKCGHRAKVESKDCGLVLYSTVAEISESLGHSDLKTTENYLGGFSKDSKRRNSSNLLNF